MSQPIPINQFSGINPKFGDSQPVGSAVTANNTDLSGNILKSQMQPEKVYEAEIGTANTFIKYAGKWYFGKDAFYNELKNFLPGNSDETKKSLLIYKDEIKLKKRIGNDAGDIADLGQPRPSKPLLEVIDDTALIVQYSIPMNGAMAKDSTEVSIKFSEEIDLDSVTKDSFSVTQYGATVPGTYRQHSTDKQAIIFKPTAPFNKTDVTVIINRDLKAVSGHVLAEPYTFTFKISAIMGITDYGPTGTWYYHGMANILHVFATFTKAIDSKSVDNASVVITCNETQHFPDETKVEGNTIRCKFAEANAPTGEWDVTFKNTITSIDGEHLENDFHWSFQAKHGLGLKLSGSFDYVVTTKRDFNGMPDESQISESTSITVTDKAIKVTFNGEFSKYTTHWCLYRRSHLTGIYCLVSEIPATTKTYIDRKTDEELDKTPTSLYTSEFGTVISSQKPPEDLDGISTSVYNGMIFGWKGSLLYWCEPSYPDAWPANYNISFPTKIFNVVPYADSVAILTAEGPYRLYGNNPELLQVSKCIGNDPCVSKAFCTHPSGVLYLSDSGVVLFNMFQTQVMTDASFGREWFRQNVSPQYAQLAATDNFVILYTGQGKFVIGDMRSDSPDWFTQSPGIVNNLPISGTVSAMWYDKNDGSLYYIVNDLNVDLDVFFKLWGGENPMPYTWRSADITLGQDATQWESIEVYGKGETSATVFVDGEQVAEKIIDFDMHRGHTLNLPDNTRGYALQVQISGSGEIKEILVNQV